MYAKQQNVNSNIYKFVSWDALSLLAEPHSETQSKYGKRVVRSTHQGLDTLLLSSRIQNYTNSKPMINIFISDDLINLSKCPSLR